nr:hypothetical protein CFP56_30493 [Quercus suber]
MANDTPLPLPEATHLAHWISPSPAQYKANCDGVIFLDINCARLGVVIRDSEGMVIATLSERVPLPPSIDNLEALACRKSITLAHEIGLQGVIFEGDSEVVFKHITTNSTCLASFGHIFEESRSLVSRLQRASFSHVKCCCNVVVDKLAKLAKYSLDPQIWLEDIHRDATNLVIINRNFLSI